MSVSSIHTLVALAAQCIAAVGLAAPQPASAQHAVTLLTQADFKYGTYIIDRPGTYRLAENISFNPNSPATLTEAIDTGLIDPATAAGLGLASPVDAFSAGMPLPTQFAPLPNSPFAPGGPLDPRYDPAGFGLGFFAAIVIMADDVTLDLNGHTLEQSAEHALLQRFFAVVELAEQPFIPAQGPADFGSDIVVANRVRIVNGTIGRSAHHGIHGNGNDQVVIADVDFIGYEVAAVALNGVTNLRIHRSEAVNRKDVPVLGTFSSVQFLKPYVAELVRVGSPTTLTVNGVTLTPTDALAAMRDAVNNVHRDVIVRQFSQTGRAQIDPVAHPDEYALFHNPFGVVDGNSYSYLVNRLGVAVNGFPFRPLPGDESGASDVWLSRLTVRDQRAFINEVVALNQSGSAVTDPVGAVFQTRNRHPDTGAPLTVTSLDPAAAVYTGNVAANAQALVGKAIMNGDFAGSLLDISRNHVTADVVRWVEGEPGFETLASVAPTPSDYLCNGDSMFHVNKGVIGVKLSAVRNVLVNRLNVDGIENLGLPGDAVCGDYGAASSHPAATLPGYGGAATRAISLSGAENVIVVNGRGSRIGAASGAATGIDLINDTRNVYLINNRFDRIEAGLATSSYDAPNTVPLATGLAIGDATGEVRAVRFCARRLTGAGGAAIVADRSGAALLRGICR